MSKQKKMFLDDLDYVTSTPPSLSPKNNNYKQPLSNLIASISKQQHHKFYDISQKCSAMEYAVTSIEVLLTQLS